MFWAKSVVPTLNTPQQLSALMVGVDANAPTKGQRQLELQVAIEGGNCRMYIGSDNTVSPTNWGVELTAGQCWAPPDKAIARDLSQVWMYCDTAGVIIGVTTE